MGIFGAMTTAVSGLRSQAYALENISGNIANSQTTGFKRVETSFVDLLPDMPARKELAGSVTAFSRLTNTIQGDLQPTGVSTHMALNGEGFFIVQERTGYNGSQPTFGGVDLYTRRGDFSIDKDGFLVNGAGYYLRGTSIDPDHRAADGHRHGHRADLLRAPAGPADERDPVYRQPAGHSRHGGPGGCSDRLRIRAHGPGARHPDLPGRIRSARHRRGRQPGAGGGGDGCRPLHEPEHRRRADPGLQRGRRAHRRQPALGQGVGRRDAVDHDRIGEHRRRLYARRRQCRQLDHQRHQHRLGRRRHRDLHPQQDQRAKHDDGRRRPHGYERAIGSRLAGRQQQSRRRRDGRDPDQPRRDGRHQHAGQRHGYLEPVLPREPHGHEQPARLAQRGRALHLQFDRRDDGAERGERDRVEPDRRRQRRRQYQLRFPRLKRRPDAIRLGRRPRRAKRLAAGRLFVRHARIRLGDQRRPHLGKLHQWPRRAGRADLGRPVPGRQRAQAARRRRLRADPGIRPADHRPQRLHASSAATSKARTRTSPRNSRR